MSNKNKIMAFKAFDKNMKCREFQYEVGREYEQDGDVKLCECGFHACENPFDVWNYYPINSKYARVELSGEIKKDGDKSVCSKIKIKAELSFPDFIRQGVEYLIRIASTSKSNNEHFAQIGSSGDSAKIGSSGYSAQIESKGKDSVVAAIGVNSCACGEIGSWLTLAEYDAEYKPVCVKSRKIDGNRLKAGVYYKLKDKKFIEV